MQKFLFALFFIFLQNRQRSTVLRMKHELFPKSFLSSYGFAIKMYSRRLLILFVHSWDKLIISCHHTFVCNTFLTSYNIYFHLFNFHFKINNKKSKKKTKIYLASLRWHISYLRQSIIQFINWLTKHLYRTA